MQRATIHVWPRPGLLYIPSSLRSHTRRVLSLDAETSMRLPSGAKVKSRTTSVWSIRFSNSFPATSHQIKKRINEKLIHSEVQLLKSTLRTCTNNEYVSDTMFTEIKAKIFFRSSHILHLQSVKKTQKPKHNHCFCSLTQPSSCKKALIYTLFKYSRPICSGFWSDNWKHIPSIIWYPSGIHSEKLVGFLTSMNIQVDCMPIQISNLVAGSAATPLHPHFFPLQILSENPIDENQLLLWRTLIPVFTGTARTPSLLQKPENVEGKTVILYLKGCA